MSRLGCFRRRWFGRRLPNPELHYAFLRRAGNYCLNEYRVSVEVHLDEAQITLVRFGRDPLHFIGVRVLNEDYEFPVVFQPAGEK